jgi:hypothetical protein
MGGAWGAATPASTDDSTSTPAAAATTSTPTAASTNTAASTTSTSSGASSAAGAASPAIADAVAACKSSINAAPTLNATEKSQLDALCTQAANGNAAGIQKATAKVCVEIIKDTVPAGSAQTEAEAACPKA